MTKNWSDLHNPHKRVRTKENKTKSKDGWTDIPYSITFYDIRPCFDIEASIDTSIMTTFTHTIEDMKTFSDHTDRFEGPTVETNPKSPTESSFEFWRVSGVWTFTFTIQ